MEGAGFSGAGWEAWEGALFDGAWPAAAARLGAWLAQAPLAWSQPAWLWLLPLAALAWLRRGSGSIAVAQLRSLPVDRLSQSLALALRWVRAGAIAALVLVLAGPYRPEATVERAGTGAEVVLVLDRSRSMDQGFGGVRAGAAPRGTGPETIDYYMRIQQQRGAASKAQVARTLLGDFAARRPNDRFAMVSFSTLPMKVLGFTQKPDIIQAAIQAGKVGRGLAETDIGLALTAALDTFDGRPYTGSRVIMLVSDGGDHLEPGLRDSLAERFQRGRIGLTWLYLRATNSGGLSAAQDSAAGSAEGLPEVFLHRFFGGLGVPYRVYEADNPEALRDAIADVDRLENLPITYTDTEPRRDLSSPLLALALACTLLLLLAQALERRTWA